jgi:hypothetical protein
MTGLRNTDALWQESAAIHELEKMRSIPLVSKKEG